jgi:hypothetical protein
MVVALKVCIVFCSLFQEEKRMFWGHHWSKENHTILPIAVMNQDYTITSEI